MTDGLAGAVVPTVSFNVDGLKCVNAPVNDPVTEPVTDDALTLPFTVNVFCKFVVTPIPTFPLALINIRVVLSLLGPPANNRTLDDAIGDAFPRCNSPTLDVRYKYPSLGPPTNPPLYVVLLIPMLI